LPLCFIFVVSAHPGKTDSHGAHTDHSTGIYHYHHGYPAHNHINGECPYDFDDKTNHDSSTELNSKNTTLNVTDVYDIPIPTPEPNNGENSNLLVIGLSVILGGGTAYAIISGAKISKSPKTSAVPGKDNKQEYEYYFKLYSFYDPLNFVTLPKGEYIRNGLPVTSDKGTYGKYTVYISNAGNKYHQNINCVNAKMMKKHVYSVLSTHTPCRKCVKDSIPSLDWYKEYVRIANIKRNYNIP
jgi:hypothetical protein